MRPLSGFQCQPRTAPKPCNAQTYDRSLPAVTCRIPHHPRGQRCRCTVKADDALLNQCLAFRRRQSSWGSGRRRPIARHILSQQRSKPAVPVSAPRFLCRTHGNQTGTRLSVAHVCGAAGIPDTNDGHALRIVVGRLPLPSIRAQVLHQLPRDGDQAAYAHPDQ